MRIARNEEKNGSKELRRWQIASGILAFMLVTAIGYSAYVTLRGSFVQGAYANPYPHLDIARNFVPQEHFVIDIDPLREQLRAIEARERGEYEISLYFEFLNTGANVQINPDLKVWPASLLKVPAAITVMKKVEKGEWQLDSELVVTNGDKDAGYGQLWESPLGSRFTIEELLREMLINSDNTAYNMFLRNLPKDDLRDTLVELGIEDLFNESGQISAKEYSRLLRALYTSSFLKRENSEFLINILLETDFNKFLSQSVPDTVPFAHKFGVREDVNAYLDSGIAYVPQRPYLITVAIKGTGAENEAESVQELMEEISSAAYEYVSTK